MPRAWAENCEGPTPLGLVALGCLGGSSGWV
jgi:hypothetical protein